MPHALIENGVVVQLDLTGSPPAGYVECPGHVQPGYTFSGGDFHAPQSPAPTSSDVNAERDRRVAAGIAVTIDGYGPVPLQGRDQDQTNLLGLVTAANLRIASGDTATLTKFRDAENVDHMLTPPQIIEMWLKGSAWISAVYDASWTLKAMDPIPADYANDSRWP